MVNYDLLPKLLPEKLHATRRAFDRALWSKAKKFPDRSGAKEEGMNEMRD
jgi:hypothetical protein